MSRKKPIRLTEEVIEKLAMYIENGNFARDACMLVGVSEAGYYKWLDTGKSIIDGKKRMTEKNRLTVELVEAIKYADAKFKAYHLSNINTAGKHTWQASAWMLERRFPSEYARREPDVQVTTDGKSSVTIYIPDNNRDGNSLTA